MEQTYFSKNDLNLAKSESTKAINSNSKFNLNANMNQNMNNTNFNMNNSIYYKDKDKEFNDLISPSSDIINILSSPNNLNLLINQKKVSKNGKVYHSQSTRSLEKIDYDIKYIHGAGFKKHVKLIPKKDIMINIRNTVNNSNNSNNSNYILMKNAMKSIKSTQSK